MELSAGFTYRSMRNAPGATRSIGPHWSDQTNQRFVASYVTGSHNIKAGIQTMQGALTYQNQMYGNVNYNFLNGVPNQIVEWTTPYTQEEHMKLMMGLFAQDQWTVSRATFNYGLRFDYLNSLVPPQSAPATQFVGARNYAEVDCVPCWKDLSPRFGVAYDLFGNGNTAVKVNVGRYVLGEMFDLASAVNPFATSVNSVTRPWSDANHDFIPQGDLSDPNANGELGPISNRNFGNVSPSTIYQDEVLKGWFVRPYTWQFSGSVQRRLASALSLSVGYYRTWFGNFRATDNVALTPADFNAYSITVPADSRLPNGGGYTVTGLYDVTPTKNGVANNLVVQASNFGMVSEVYNGVDVTVNGRFKNWHIGGGLSTGQDVTDVCDIISAHPEVTVQLASGSVTSSGRAPTPASQCRNTPPWSALTQVKLNGLYQLPKTMRVSVVLQNNPAPPTNAAAAVLNSNIAPSLGRNLAACGSATTCNQTVSIPFYANGTQYFEHRLTQMDVRFTKTVTVQRLRIDGNVDLYNAFNANSVLMVNGTYGGSVWTTPLQTLQGRILELGFQVYF
jgi:hypothetical protein